VAEKDFPVDVGCGSEAGYCICEGSEVKHLHDSFVHKNACSKVKVKLKLRTATTGNTVWKIGKT
jgi:hypothetical protein